MTGDRRGPFEIVRELGSGGMGTVYLARAEGAADGWAAGDLVALKVLHPHLLVREDSRRRFRREADAGVRVRHENVVRTLGVAELPEGERPATAIVMEAVSGRTLRELLDELGTLPEPLIRELAAQVAAGLAAIHAAGVVHRDLKPENVLVTEEQRVRIMDLGVSRVVDESLSLTREGRFAGSILYAAPEQFRGEGAGPAADQYALGVVLYELAAGGNPFARDDVAAVMKAHLARRPPTLRDRGLPVSEFLSEVVARLLAMEPAGRFPSAAALAEVLGGGERSEWWRERSAVLAAERGATSHRPDPAAPALVGRDAELGTLRRALADAMEGRGRTVLVEGEAGIGKSRLVDELLADAADVEILHGGYTPDIGLGALSQAILDRFGAAGLEAALGRLLDTQAGIVPAFAARVRHESPPPGHDPVGGDVLHALTVALMRAIARRRPLLWVVEDLHHAERDSRRVALAMARAVAGHRILLVLTTRPGVPEDELATLGRVPGVERVRLGRLSPREVIELLAASFGSSRLAERHGGKIAYKSDGVPWFVMEIVRGLLEGKFLTRRADGSLAETRTVEEIEVPSAVRDLVAARLEGLTEEERAVLDLAAVLGFRFDADLLARVRQVRRVAILERLAAVGRRTGLVRADGPGFAFDQHQVQELLYEGLPEGLRAEYHDLLVEAFEARAAADATDTAAAAPASGEAALFLARHRLAGNHPERAEPVLDAALSHHEASYRAEAALALVGKALSRIDGLPTERRFELLERKSSWADQVGRREDQPDVLDEMERLAAASGSADLVARARFARGEHHIGTGNFADAARELEEVLRLADEGGDPGRRGRAMRLLGNVAHGQGREEEALEWFRRTREEAGAAGDRWLERAAVGNLGTVLASLGRPAEALACQRECLEIVNRLGDRRGQAITSCNLGNLHLDAGRWDEARECFLRYRDVSREIGYRQGIANAAGNLGNLASMKGRNEEALEHHEENLAMAVEIGDRKGEATARLNLGGVRALCGEFERARELDEAARAIAEEIGDRRLLGHAFRALGTIAEAVDDDRAGDLYRDAVRVWEEAGYARVLPNARMVLGGWLGVRGERAAALVELRAALRGAEEAGLTDTRVLVLCHLAALEGGEAVALAKAAFETAEPAMSHSDRTKARQLLDLPAPPEPPEK